MWDKVGKTILLYPNDFTTIFVGEGYLLRSDIIQSPSYYGLAWRTDVSIPLPARGWSWIGHPHRTPVLLSSVRVTNEDLGETRTVAQDMAAGSDSWVNWNLLYWNSYEDTAKLLAVSGGDDNMLRPWYGYRIWTERENLTLIMPVE